MKQLFNKLSKKLLGEKVTLYLPIEKSRAFVRTQLRVIETRPYAFRIQKVTYYTKYPVKTRVSRDWWMSTHFKKTHYAENPEQLQAIMCANHLWDLLSEAIDDLNKPVLVTGP